MKTPQYNAIDIPVLRKKYTVARATALFSLLGILIIFTFNNFTQHWGSLTIWVVQCLPLLIFIPGILKSKYRTYSWLCFVLLVYFINTVVNAMASSVPLPTYILLALIVILFIVAMMASRWQQHLSLAIQQNSSTA